MSADPFGRVSLGQPIFPSLGARWFNTVSEAAADYERRKLGAGGKALAGSDEAAVFVAVVGSSPGGDQAAHRVYALAGGTAATDLANRPLDFRRDPVFTAGRPTSTHEATYAEQTSGTPTRPVVSVGPVAAGGLGRAVVAGVAVCDVEVLDATHNYCAPAPTLHRMVSRKQGLIPILYRESGTGVKKAAVLLGYNDPPPAVTRRLGLYTIPETVTSFSGSTIDLDPGDWHLTLSTTLAAEATLTPGLSTDLFVFGGFGAFSSTTGLALAALGVAHCWTHRWVVSTTSVTSGHMHSIEVSHGATRAPATFHALIRVANRPARIGPYFFKLGTGSGSFGGGVISAVRVRAFAEDLIITVAGDGPQTPPGQGNGFVPEALREAWEDDDGAAEGEDAVYAARLAAVGAGDNDQSIEGGTD